jgi:CRP/FNR family transcriptional regulator/CRP/FNR family cyclic AMP-dependent transcriptional regulator
MPRVLSSADQVTGAMLATPLLKGVPAKAVLKLADAGRVRNFRKGSYLCHQGDEADEIYFLIEGRVEISSISVTGSRVLHASVDMPQFVGELGVLAEIDRTASVLTLEDSVVWIAAADDFLGFLGGEPSAARSLLRVLARQVHSHEAFVDDLLFLDLKGRVAKRLLQMATPSLDDLPPDGTAIPGVTHADLASLCGGSRENVTRVLSEFQRRGLVKRDGKRYVLVKTGGLARIANL